MRGGGAERVALNLVEEFCAAGIETDLVLVRREGPLLAQIPDTVRIIDLGASRARWAVRRLRSYLTASRPRAVIGIGLDANLAAVLASIGLREKPQLILSVHNVISRINPHWPAWRHRLNARMMARLYRRADHVVAASDGGAGDLIAAGIDRPRPVRIHNPVLRMERAASALPASHAWFGDPTVPVVIAAGRLTAQKDHALLLHAFANVVKRRAAKLMIVGEGPLRPKLERLIVELQLTGKVALLGYRDDIYGWMKAADLFVLSSASEGFGNVLVEAMATGTPVVATDCPHGPREILEDGQWGRLVPPGDPDALAQAIIGVLADGGIDARRRAADFSPRTAAIDYLALIDPGLAEAVQ